MATYNKEELDYIAGQVKPYVLEQIQTDAAVIDDVELVTETDGITTLPAYDERGGVKKVVRVPLATFAKPAEEAVAGLEESIAAANTAAENANTAAANVEGIAGEIEGLKTDVEQALEDTATNLEQVSTTLAEITDAEAGRVSAENTRIANENARVDAETDREESFATAIANVEAATENANDTAEHPTKIGEDNYVYVWNKETQTYDKTDILVRGDAGKDPILEMGDVTTLEAGTSASAEMVQVGTSDDGQPIYSLSLSIPRGEKGQAGDGTGNVLVDATSLQVGTQYLFTPKASGSPEGIFVGYVAPDVPTTTSDLINDSDFATNASVDAKISKIPTPDVSGQISDHNTDESAHPYIQNNYAKTADLAAVATSGSYDDLSDKPTIPDMSELNASFVATTEEVDEPENPEWKAYVDAKVPTNVSQLANDSGYVTESEADQSYQPKGIVTYSMVNHGTSDTTFTLTPNVYHVWGEVSSLTLTLGSEVSGVMNDYFFQFSSGATATTLTLPDGLKWANDETIVPEANKMYQFSIVSGGISVLTFNAE